MTHSGVQYMRPSIGIVQRMFRAWKHLEATVGETVVQGRLGDMTAAELERSAPFDQGTVSGWFKRGIREIDVVWAFARACGVSPSWLAFNEGDMIPSSTRTGVTPDVPWRERERMTAEEALRELPEGERAASRPKKKGNAR